MRPGGRAAAVFLLAPALLTPLSAAPPAPPLDAEGPADAGVAQAGDLVDRAYEAAYNLDHDEAMALARRAVAAAPDDPAAHRALASITWLHILFLRGAVTVDHYLGGITRSDKKLPVPPADLDALFREHVNRAIALAEARLKTHPADVGARFDAGSAYGLLASYTASVEGSLGAAFRTAKRAFDAQEAVLEREPARSDAGVVVGTYRYLVSALRLPTRLLAYLAGFGGGKERGIAMLESASRNPSSEIEAGTALLLIYSREGRHRDALTIARRLEARYPRNRLLTLEAGAAAVRAGEAGIADEILTRGIAAFEADARPKMPAEHAWWFYKRGLARLSLNHPRDARADLDRALASPSPGWVEGRIRTALGQLDDLAGRRQEALAQYHRARILCRQQDDALGAAEADRWLRRPFSFDAVKRSGSAPGPAAGPGESPSWGMLSLDAGRRRP